MEKAHKKLLAKIWLVGSIIILFCLMGIAIGWLPALGVAGLIILASGIGISMSILTDQL